MRSTANRVRRRLWVGASLLSVLVLALAPSAGSAASTAAASGAEAATANGPYVTLLFSRTEITAADDCVVNNTNVVRLDTTVAPYLTSLGMTATGTLTTAKTKDTAMFCTHYNSTMAASWAQAAALANKHGWSFVSHTATYPMNLEALTSAQSWAETCGSARTLDSRGLRGGRGLIAYPGAQSSPVSLHTNYGSKCFAWGRQYGGNGTTSAAAARTAPYWQNTVAPNGGPCNDLTAACSTIAATGSKRYQLPSKFVGYINALDPGEWFTLQTYILVTGKSPAYRSSTIRWDCTSANPRLHWTNDNERYCYKDWQAIIRAIDAKPGVVVTDPLTVGVAWGRPATYS